MILFFFGRLSNQSGVQRVRFAGFVCDVMSLVCLSHRQVPTVASNKSQQVERQRVDPSRNEESTTCTTDISQQLLLSSVPSFRSKPARSKAPCNKQLEISSRSQHQPEHPSVLISHTPRCSQEEPHVDKNMNPPTSSFVLSSRPLAVAEAEEARGSSSAVLCPPRGGERAPGGGFCAAATGIPPTTPTTSKAKEEDKKGITTTNNNKARRGTTRRGSRNLFSLSKVKPTRPSSTVEAKRSKSPPLSPAALCRQHTDVSALTWDDGDGGGAGGNGWMLHGDGGGACSPPPLPVRQPTLGAQIMQPSRPPRRASADEHRPSLGRRAAAVGGLIDDDEKSVDHPHVVTLTTSTAQPPKMPVRKVSNLVAEAPTSGTVDRNRTRLMDLGPLSSSAHLPPALPLRQATLNTVATADSTAIASHTVQESSERRHESERVGSSPRADADVARTLLTRLTHHLHTDGPGTAHAIRHGADDSDAHPPIMPVRQRSLLAHVEPTAAAERLPSDSCDLRGVVVAGGRPWGCSAPRATSFVPLSLAEGPPHPPSRKASG
jgi:hypothetical protein